MNLFKNYTFTWWQIGIFKLALLSIGVLIGTYWNEIFQPHLTALLVIAVVTTVYVISISLKQSRN